MDIKYLKYFTAVAECGSINKAASTMYISQPHLSYIIREIEDEAGVRLFDRTNRGIQLTPAGEEWLYHCRNILAETASMMNLGAGSPEDRLTLSISATRFTETAICFTELCRRYQKKPEYTLKYREGSTTAVVREVAEGQSDLGVVHFSGADAAIMNSAFAERKLSFAPVARILPCIAVSSAHPLIRNHLPVTPESVRDYGFIRYLGEYEDFFYRIDTEDGRYDFTSWPRIICVNDREAQLRLLAGSDCFTVGIPNFENQAKRYRVLSIPVRNARDKLWFGILVPSAKKKNLTAIEKDFLDIVRQQYAKLQGKERQNRS